MALAQAKPNHPNVEAFRRNHTNNIETCTMSALACKRSVNYFGGDDPFMYCAIVHLCQTLQCQQEETKFCKPVSISALSFGFEKSVVYQFIEAQIADSERTIARTNDAVKVWIALSKITISSYTSTSMACHSIIKE